MLKLIGIVFVLCACTLGGRKAALMYAKRPLQLRMILQGLQYLETEIVYVCTPLPVAFDIVGHRIHGIIGDVFTETAKQLLAYPEKTPREAWEEAYAAHKEDVYLKKEDNQILHAFLLGLGQSHREEQLKQINLVKELLKAELEKSLEEGKKFTKVYGTLGVSIGLTLVILLF